MIVGPWMRWLRSIGEAVKSLQAQGGAVVSVAWDAITGKPSTFPPSTHTHPQYLTEEVDPTVPAHVKGISPQQITGWDAPEDDPVFTASPAKGITLADIDRWNRPLWENLYNQYTTVTRVGIVTEQSLAGTGIDDRTIPAGRLNAQGFGIEVYLCGVYSTDVTPGTATIRIRLGSTTYRTIGPFALDQNITNGIWYIRGRITCRTTGETGTVGGQLMWEHQASAVAGAEVLHAQSPTSFSDVTLDLTADQEFDVDWTATDAGTSISCSCFALTAVR